MKNKEYTLKDYPNMGSFYDQYTVVEAYKATMLGSLYLETGKNGNPDTIHYIENGVKRVNTENLKKMSWHDLGVTIVFNGNIYYKDPDFAPMSYVHTTLGTLNPQSPTLGLLGAIYRRLTSCYSEDCISAVTV